MTADYISHHAVERPDSVALINDGRVVTYAEFDRDLGKFTAALRAFGLSRGRLVAVGWGDFYIHWLLLLAFEQLGVATVSFIAETPEDSPLLMSANFVIADPHFHFPSAKPHQLITSEWLDGVRAREKDPNTSRLPSRPDDPIRILHTSGTTGAFKRVAVSRQHHETRVAQNAFKYRFTVGSRYLITMPFSVGVVYSCATACVRLGTPVVAGASSDPATVIGALTAHGITHVTLLPLQLQQVLDMLPENFERPPALTVFTLGAAVSGTLRRKTLSRLATNLCSGYGCNEVGIISFTYGDSPDQIESLCPGVIVETLDERGQATPPGQPGQIRVRTPCMADSYLNDPGASQRMFRNGWFYPGDIGVLDGPRRLRVIGRADEILNIGGAKIPPGVLEEMILAGTPIREIGVCSIPNSAGIEEVHIAVAGTSARDEQLLDWISEALRPIPIGAFRVVKLPAIPRNAAGKIQRSVLKTEVMSATGGTALSR